MSGEKLINDMISSYLTMQEYDKLQIPSTSTSTPVSGSISPVSGGSGSITPISGATTPAPESKAAHGQFSTQELISILEIPPHLAVKSTKDAGLQLYYAKYQACLKAMNNMQTKFKEGIWPAPKMISRTSLIELCISKTMWHSHVHKYFKNIADYPQMQIWLEGGDDAPADLDLWGFAKTAYSFNDLAAYLKEQDKLKAKKGKGKAKKDGIKEKGGNDETVGKGKKGEKKGKM